MEPDKKNNGVNIGEIAFKAEREAEPVGEKIDVKTEARLMTALNKLFNENTDDDEKRKYLETPLKDIGVILDLSQMLGVQPLNVEGRRILSRFSLNTTKTLKIDYSAYGKEPQAAIYTAKITYDIIGILKCVNEPLKITLRKDAPLMIENSYFRFYLAPRLEAA